MHEAYRQQRFVPRPGQSARSSSFAAQSSRTAGGPPRVPGARRSPQVGSRPGPSSSKRRLQREFPVSSTMDLPIGDMSSSSASVAITGCKAWEPISDSFGERRRDVAQDYSRSRSGLGTALNTSLMVRPPKPLAISRRLSKTK